MLRKSKEVAEIIAIATLRTQQEIEDMLKSGQNLYTGPLQWIQQLLQTFCPPSYFNPTTRIL